MPFLLRTCREERQGGSTTGTYLGSHRTHTLPCRNLSSKLCTGGGSSSRSAPVTRAPPQSFLSLLAPRRRMCRVLPLTLQAPTAPQPHLSPHPTHTLSTLQLHRTAFYSQLAKFSLPWGLCSCFFLCRSPFPQSQVLPLRLDTLCLGDAPDQSFIILGFNCHSISPICYLPEGRDHVEPQCFLPVLNSIVNTQ